MTILELAALIKQASEVTGATICCSITYPPTLNIDGNECCYETFEDLFAHLREMTRPTTEDLMCAFPDAFEVLEQAFLSDRSVRVVVDSPRPCKSNGKAK